MKNKAVQDKLGTGRRKTAVASVRLRDGKGKVLINGRDFSIYFPLEAQRELILAPLVKVSTPASYDILVRLSGGGISSQAEAMRLGIARALLSEDETLKQTLKEHGFLTRDSRKKERKKYGRAKARKRFQFSKR